MKTPLEIAQQMVDKLNYYTKLYDEGNPAISDREWDDLYFQLQLYENTHGIYLADSPTQKISYEVKNALTKVEHGHPMLSLQKTKDLDIIRNFARKAPCLMMLKMDGLTCSLRYEGGYLVSAETRGNGIIGEDILHNAKVIKNIPKKIDYQDTLVIDGEVICSYHNFEQFSDAYKNPRNFASGSIRLLDSEECESRGLSFIAWDIIEGFDEMNSLADKMIAIQHLGFTLVPGVGYAVDEIEEQINCLKSLAQYRGLPIDGLVFKYDDVDFGRSLGATEHHSNNAIAYKFYDEEYETKLLDIEWTMGRTGILTPVAIVEPVDTGDSIVERASLHNLTVMHETLGEYPYRGQPVRLIKSNMIIPQIVWADKELAYLPETVINIPVICPICGELVSIIGDNNSEFVCCSNPMCEGKLVNILDHFCSKKGLDIRGLSKNTLEKLIDWGWVYSIVDIFKLNEYAIQWKQKPGFGDRSVDNILSAIEDSKKCKLSNFITALGIPLVGTATAKELEKEFKTWADFRNAIASGFNFYSLAGFGIEMHYAISKFDYTMADFIANEYLTFETEATPDVEATLEGITVVITGKLNHFKNRGELQKLIEAAGGKVAGSVSKNTAYLINNDTESSSSKNLTAKKLGVKIISEEEFITNFLTL